MSDRGQHNKKRCIRFRRAGKRSYGSCRQETRRMEGESCSLSLLLCSTQNLLRLEANILKRAEKNLEI